METQHDTAHRTGELIVTVTDADGTPRAGTEVVVEQRRHEFGFGNIGFDFIGLANGEHDPDDVGTPRARRPLARRLQHRHPAVLLGPLRTRARPPRHRAAAADGRVVP
ncbi:hypothetical protein [Curtobacterium sp. PsM8]|uniref:hypothetical protein n=1 Tax=Curtobacterium sp. PsM8 TaxID=3030532 RepID=UPI00345E99FB